MAKCCICDRHIEREDAPVLSMGAGGNPRMLCEECEGLLDTATRGHDFDEIEAAMDKLGKLMADGNPDRVTFSIVNDLMYGASDRAKAIKEGSYDFALDDEPVEDGGLEDIPEDMLESEEDKKKDEAEQKKMAKFDKVYNVLITILAAATLLMLTWKLVDIYSPSTTMAIKDFFGFYG